MANLQVPFRPNAISVHSAFDGRNHALIDVQRSGSGVDHREGYSRVTFTVNFTSVVFNFPKRKGKWLVEVTKLDTSSSNGVGAGLARPDVNTETFIGFDNEGVALFWESFGIFTNNAQDSATPTLTESNISFVMAIDMTGNDPVMHFVVDRQAVIDTTYTWTLGNNNINELVLAMTGSVNDKIRINTGRRIFLNPHVDRLFPDFTKGWMQTVTPTFDYFHPNPRIMSSLVKHGGLVSAGGMAGVGGGLAG